MALIDEDVPRITDIYLNTLNVFSEIYDEIEEGYRFVAGQQFTQKQRKWYELNKKPANVFNIIFPIFNTTIGEFILNNAKIRVYPRPGGDVATAAQLEDFLDNLTLDNEVKQELVKTMIAAMIRMGYIHVRYSDERQIDGSIVISNEDEFGILFDPRAKHPFLDDARYMIRNRWMELDEILHLAPHVRKRLQEFNDRLMGKELWSQIQFENEQFAAQADNPMLQDRKNGKFRVIEFHEMLYEKAPVAVNTLTGDAEPFFLEGKRADVYLKLNPHVKIIDREIKVKYVTTVVPALMTTIEKKHKALIQDNRFDFIPLIPYAYSRYTKDGFGVMRNIIPIQKDYNAFKNKSMEMIDKSVNLPIMYKPDNLLNPKEVEYYGQKTGIKVKVKSGKQINDSFVQGKPPTFPFTTEQISKEDYDLLMRISSITPNFMGLSEHSQEPASLFAQKLRQAQKSIAVIDMNFRTMKKRLYEKAVKALQQNVKTEKYFYMAGAGKEIGFNIPSANKILFDLSVGEYDVFISTLQQDPTARQIRFMQKTELVQFIANLYGAQAIDPQWWLEDADLGDIGQLIENIKAVIQGQAIQAQKQEALQDQAAVIGLAKNKLQLEGEDVK